MKYKDIDAFIEDIISRTEIGADVFDWNKNEIMRFVYVKLGDLISKSMDFFYSREGKYDDQGLSVEEMKRIHEQQASFEVTCKVTARMLKRIYDAVGIECEVKDSMYAQVYETKEGNYPVYHSYLIATGEGGKKYFLSLNNDLVNIKTNAKTECFGAKIPYFYNGKQNYPGEEIQYSTFTDKQLLEIDKRVKYAIPMLNDKGGTDYVYSLGYDMYGKNARNNEEYLNIKLKELDKEFLSEFYNVCKKTKKECFYEYTQEELSNLKWFTIYSAYNLISRKLGIDTTQSDTQLTQALERSTKGNVFDTEEMFKYIEEFIKQNANGKSTDEPFVIYGTTKKLIEAISALTNKNLEEDKLSFYSRSYRGNLKKLSKMFLPEEVLKQYQGDRNPSNKFIFDKLKTMFELDFECECSKICDYRPDDICKKMGMVEQGAFVKGYLMSLFRMEFPTEDEFYKRILFSSMTKIGNRKEHAFLIHIKTPEGSKQTEYTLLYDPQINQLIETNYLEVKSDYDVYSKTMINYFEGEKKEHGEQEK